MKRIFAGFTILVFGFAAAPPGFAETVEIRGVVVTPGGIPIEGALVLHRPTGTNTATDILGAFAMAVPQRDRIRLELIHPDFYEREFVVSGKLSDPVEIVLSPLVRQSEEIVVTARRHAESAATVAAAGSVIASETLVETMAPNVALGLQELPGVAALGSGGFTLVPTIRGMARRKVLYLVDFARVTSDRRTGPNASFLSPDDIERIEIVRSSSSVHFGSDAIGGVIHAQTRSPEIKEGIRGGVQARYGGGNDEKSAGLSIQAAKNGWGGYLSFRGIDAENYRSPAGEILQSQYSQSGVFGKIVRSGDRREISLTFLGSRGRNIGKPADNSRTRPTWYPREDNNLMLFRWVEKHVAEGRLTFQAYANPNFLETRRDTLAAYKTGESFSRTESTDFGFQLSYGKKVAARLRLESGLDYFGRTGVRAENTETSFDADGRTVSVFREIPYDGGRREDIGAFVSLDYTGIPGLDLAGGVRFDLLAMQADPGGSGNPLSSKKSTATGFLAASYHLTEDVVVFTNISRAYRVPGLGEKFYTGITGRGMIVAAPDLRPEASLNFDGGIKYIGRRAYAAVYGFVNTIDDMIERFQVSPRVYTYGNVDRGRLQGVECEWEIFPVSGWKVFGNLMAMTGRSLQAEAPLNDVPSFRLHAGTRAWWRRLSAEISVHVQSAKKNPGPAEIAIPAYETVNLRFGWTPSESVRFHALLSNLFDKTYIARPDAEAVFEPGRALGVGLSFSF
jgi:hemoglobin/transferrin/lactoferrin receptor protein